MSDLDQMAADFEDLSPDEFENKWDMPHSDFLEYYIDNLGGETQVYEPTFIHGPPEERKPISEEEQEEMEIANTEVLADIHNEVAGFFLTLKVIPSSKSILDQRGNWGWIYLRHEYDN